jgi:hypothetical protein
MCIAAGWPNGVPPLAGHILYTCVTAIYALNVHTHRSCFVFIYFNAHWRDRSCHIFQGITCLMCMGSGCCWKPSEMSSTCPPSSFFYMYNIPLAFSLFFPPALPTIFLHFRYSQFEGGSRSVSMYTISAKRVNMSTNSVSNSLCIPV